MYTEDAENIVFGSHTRAPTNQICLPSNSQAPLLAATLNPKPEDAFTNSTVCLFPATHFMGGSFQAPSSQTTLEVHARVPFGPSTVRPQADVVYSSA